MKHIQKLLALCLILCLALSLAPAAFADDKIGDGVVGQVVVAEAPLSGQTDIVAAYVTQGTGTITKTTDGDLVIADNNEGTNFKIEVSQVDKDVTVTVENPIEIATADANTAAMDVGSLAETTFTVNTQSITNTGEGGGVHVVNGNNEKGTSTTNINVNGDITTSKGYGIDASSVGGELNMTAGNVNAGGTGVRADDTTEENNGTGTQGSATVSGSGESKPTAKVEVNNIEAGGDGIEAQSINGGSITVTANDVNAGGNGVEASVTGSGSVEVTTAGVTAKGDGIEVSVIGSGSAEVTAADVNADKNGIEATLSGEGSVIVSVDSVTAKEIGIVVNSSNGSTKEGSGVDILVKETVAGEAVGVALVSSSNQTENVTITAWEIKPNDQGAVVMSQTEAAGGGTTLVYDDAAKEAEKKIQYIIRLEPPKDGVTLSVTDENGQALHQVNNESVATQDTKVLMKIDIQDGYTLTGAYNGKGEKVELSKDAAGNYYVMVPKGGGVYLSVTLDKTPAPNPDPDPDPGFAPVPVPVPDTTSVAPVADNGVITKFDAALGCYSLTLTARSNSITFLRQTLEKFQKVSDNFLIITPSGSCTVLLSEILNFNEKAVNFRFTYTGSGVEIFANGELCKSISAAEMV